MGLGRRDFEGSKQFFFEKKNQKTFVSWVPVSGKSATALTEAFCFFFSKKRFPYFNDAPTSATLAAPASDACLVAAASMLSFSVALHDTTTGSTGEPCGAPVL